MKVLLVGINAKFIHSNLAIRYLKSYTSNLDYHCSTLELSINDNRDRIIEAIIEGEPDIVGFSCYIWNISLIKEISTILKMVLPQLEIIYGGPEVSYDGKNFLLETPGDYLIPGEGEIVFHDFIEAKLFSKDITKVKGLMIKKDNLIFYNDNVELINLNNIVFPYYETDDLNNKIVYYEASRGCPFSCSYCLSSTIHGVRMLPLERVKQELKFFMNKGASIVKFVDRTFNCNEKYSYELWNFLINSETSTTFHCEISADLMSSRALELLKIAPKGRIQFEIGVQTTNKTVLNYITRTIEFEKIVKNVKIISSYKNILQHLDLIAGLPGEDFCSFKKSFNDVYSLKPDEIQLGFLKLLKGSSIRDEAEKYSIIFSPQPPYEVIQTSTLSYSKLNILRRIEKLVDKYYNSNKFVLINEYLVKHFPSPFDYYMKLAEFFKEKGYFDRPISSVEYYKVFIDFSLKVLGSNDIGFNEIVKFEYLKHNKKRWLPEFLSRIEIPKQKQRYLIEQSGISNSKNNSDCHIELYSIDLEHYLKFEEIVLAESYIIYKDDYYMIFKVS